MDYSAESFVPSTLPGWTNIIDNVPAAPRSERICREHLDPIGRPISVRTEQKPTALLKTLIVKYCPPGGLVLDPFAGTLSTARACLLLNEHRRCVCTEIDEECVRLSMPALLDVFVSQLLNKDSDIKGNEEVMKAACIYKQRRESIRAKMVRNAWMTPAGLPSMQTFPPEVLEYLDCLTPASEAFLNYRNMPYDHWGPIFKERFNECNASTIRSHLLAINHLYLKESTIPGAGLGLFTRVAIGRNTLLGYYYGSLHYQNLGVCNKSSKKWHG